MAEFKLKQNKFFTALITSLVGWGVPVTLLHAQSGLVNCGRAGSDGEVATSEMCGYQDLVGLTNIVIDWLIGIMVIVATLLFVYAGVLYLTAGGDKDQAKNAKNIFKHAAGGFLLILLSVMIVTVIVSMLTKETWQSEWLDIIPIDLSINVMANHLIT